MLQNLKDVLHGEKMKEKSNITKKNKPKHCEGCGALFDPKAGNQCYCGPVCYRLARERKKLEVAKPKEKRMAIPEIEAAARKHGLTYGQFTARMRMEDMSD